MIKDNSHRFLFSSATYSNRSNAGFPTKAFHPQREGWSPKKWANYRNRPLLPCFYTHPLFLSFSLLCASVSSIHHQAGYSFRGDRHSSSNFLQLRIREQVSNRRRISLRSGKNYSPRDLVFHVSVTFGMRICSTISKVFGTRATPGSIALAIDFAQPPLGLRRPREGTRGGGKMRHRVSLEIRLQIYSSRSTRR